MDTKPSTRGVWSLRTVEREGGKEIVDEGWEGTQKSRHIDGRLKQALFFVEAQMSCGTS